MAPHSPSILPLSAVLRSLFADANHGPTKNLRTRSPGLMPLDLRGVKPPYALNNHCRLGVHVVHQPFADVAHPDYDADYDWVGAARWHPAPRRAPNWDAVVADASLCVTVADDPAPWYADPRLDPDHPDFQPYPQKTAVVWLASLGGSRDTQKPVPTSRRPQGTDHSDHWLFALAINMWARSPDDLFDIAQSIQLTDSAHGTAEGCSRHIIERAVRHLRIQMQMLVEGDARRLLRPCAREQSERPDPTCRPLFVTRSGGFAVQPAKAHNPKGAPVTNAATLRWKTRAQALELNIRQLAAELREAGNHEGEALVLALITSDQAGDAQ